MTETGQNHNPKDVAVSIIIEASELLELFQWKQEKELKKVVKDVGPKGIIERLSRIRSNRYETT